jgi:hypothetical protein
VIEDHDLNVLYIWVWCIGDKKDRDNTRFFRAVLLSPIIIRLLGEDLQLTAGGSLGQAGQAQPTAKTNGSISTADLWS